MKVEKPPMHNGARIFHGLHNVAGIPASLALYEKQIGLSSRAVCYPTQMYASHIDETIVDTPLASLHRWLGEYEVFNFHFGNSLTHQALSDLPVLQAAGKRVILHYHGCDIRDSKLVLERHLVSACAECWPMACNANRNVTRKVRQKYADLITVSTPDLLEFEPRAVWLPQAVDLRYIVSAASRVVPAFSRRDDGTFYVVHAPSTSRLKGSRFVEVAIRQLQHQGIRIELVLLTGMSHDQVLASIGAADLVIDQLLIGSYGVLAVEAMSLGKPTLCYIREDVAPQFPANLPIINCTIENLAEQILKLIDRRPEWPSLQSRSIEYVRAYHDGPKVAQRMAQLYASIL